MSLGIRAKLFGGFGFVLALLIGVGFVGLINTSEFAANFRTLYDGQLVRVLQLGRVQQGLYELRLGAAVGYEQATADQRAAIKAADDKWLREVDDSMRAYQAAALNDDEAAGLKDWQATYPALVKARQQVVDLVDQGNPARPRSFVRAT